MTVERASDYPRPPVVKAAGTRIQVVFAGRTVADTLEGLRVLETNHPPTYYFPPWAVQTRLLVPSPSRTMCEWKGQARYWSLRAVDGRVSPEAVWSYTDPLPDFEAIAGWYSFHPGRVDACYVGDELVTPQDSGFYGGWITSTVAGPFKGPAGTGHW